MDESKAGSRVDKDAWERESNWLSAAIAGGVLLLVGAGFALWWVLSVDKDIERLTRVQIAAPFGVLAVAAITFFTIVWRGLISARQADTGLEQLEGLRKQIALTEENNLSALLQKGAELLADESLSKVSAGAATLQAVAEAPNRKFRNAAATLLVDYIQEKGRQGHRAKHVRQVIAAVNAAAKTNGERFPSTLDITGDRDDENDNVWELVTGCEKVSYNRGRIYEVDFASVDTRGFLFANVTFYGCRGLDVSAYNMFECIFVDCAISRLHKTEAGMNGFMRCNFSGAVIEFDCIDDLQGENHYFYSDNPPKLTEGDTRQVVWEDVFTVRDDILF
ncbi:hypothetical protein ACHMW7_19775 [Aminobacter sp. UC22_36]|uniref:hypothetical protein n=1 Tax=Aminobacter sp. UC22_36 TaxID=3374549 RepID=UPI0037566D7E